MSKRDLNLYFEDIKQAIQRIEEYTASFTFESFAKDSKTVDAVVRNLGVIGEAARSIPDDFKKQYSEIPWNDIVSMRNKVMHEYFSVAEDILWETIEKDLPHFKKQIENIKF